MRTRPRLVAAAGLFAAAAVLAGCSVVRGAFDTVKALQDAGYESPSLSQEGSAVRVSVRKETEDLDGAAREAARIVWVRLPAPVDAIHVTCRDRFGATGTYSGSREQLVADFGARDPALDEPLSSRDLRNVGLAVLAAGLAGVVTLAGIITLVVVAVRRNRRPPGEPPGGVPVAPPPPPPPFPGQTGADQPSFAPPPPEVPPR